MQIVCERIKTGYHYKLDHTASCSFCAKVINNECSFGIDDEWLDTDFSQISQTAGISPSK